MCVCVCVALGVLHSKLFKDYSVTRLHALGSSGQVCFFSKVSGQRAYSRKKMVKAVLDVNTRQSVLHVLLDSMERNLNLITEP